MSRADIHLCYICGSAEGDTRDHVFPKGLWPPPRPADLPTAPACLDCQRAHALDEEYFRTIVAGGAYANETARNLWDGKIKRSFDRSPGLRERLRQSIRQMDVTTPAGIILGRAEGWEGDRDRIGRVLKKIVRGLFYLERGDLLADDVAWIHQQVSPLTERVPEVSMEIIQQLPLRKVGDVVTYKFGFPAEEPNLTLTWVAFYERTMFLTATVPAESEYDATPF